MKRTLFQLLLVILVVALVGCSGPWTRVSTPAPVDRATPKPTLAEVQEAVGGHVCMCGDVHRHVNAIVGGV